MLFLSQLFPCCFSRDKEPPRGGYADASIEDTPEAFKGSLNTTQTTIDQRTYTTTQAAAFSELHDTMTSSTPLLRGRVYSSYSPKNEYVAYQESPQQTYSRTVFPAQSPSSQSRSSAEEPLSGKIFFARADTAKDLNLMKLIESENRSLKSRLQNFEDNLKKSEDQLRNQKEKSDERIRKLTQELETTKDLLTNISREKEGLQTQLKLKPQDKSKESEVTKSLEELQNQLFKKKELIEQLQKTNQTHLEQLEKDKGIISELELSRQQLFDRTQEGVIEGEGLKRSKLAKKPSLDEAQKQRIEQLSEENASLLEKFQKVQILLKRKSKKMHKIQKKNNEIHKTEEALEHREGEIGNMEEIFRDQERVLEGLEESHEIYKKEIAKLLETNRSLELSLEETREALREKESIIKEENELIAQQETNILQLTTHNKSLLNNLREAARLVGVTETPTLTRQSSFSEEPEPELETT